MGLCNCWFEQDVTENQAYAYLESYGGPLVYTLCSFLLLEHIKIETFKRKAFGTQKGNNICTSVSPSSVPPSPFSFDGVQQQICHYASSLVID